MVKIITLITKFIVIALAALLFGSCNRIVNLKSISGSGNVVTQTRSVQGDFKSIEVSNAIDLVIEQADKTEIKVEADDNLQDEITTTVENGVLIIGCKNGNYRNVSSRKVTVKMPVINQLEASSASTVRSTNIIKGENISLNSSSASSIDIAIESDNIFCRSSSGSSITINGKALKLETKASSGSTIAAKNLLVNTVIATASSGSSIHVHPIVSLTAKASSGASVNYSIAPKSIQKSTSSGGSITQG